MRLLESILKSFSIGRALATRRVIKAFARKFDLVYFGYVNQREDEGELIRGITVSSTHVDSHFCVGHFKGHDISLVERQSTIIYPERPPQKYRWLIMQVDLKRDDLPHIFVDANHHDELFYTTLFMKFANFTNAASLFLDRDPFFSRHFRVFTPVDKFDDVEILFDNEVTAMLAHHFRQFDYEVCGDRLLVYVSNTQVSVHLLQEMLRIGMWLANQLNKGAKKL